MLTNKQLKALAILDLHPGITARAFGDFYFDSPEHEYLFSASSNQGNGACRGKKLWLCAGSLLGKLKQKGWVRGYWKGNSPQYFCLTSQGEQALEKSRNCGCAENN